ncbi:hypothetical protein Tco_0251504 [Tanacetum coccineum]
MSARIAEAAALSPSSFQLVEDTEDNSSDSGTEREGSEEEGPNSEDEGHGSEDEGPGLGYGALRHHELVVGEGEMPSTFEILPSLEWSSSSLPVSPSSPAIPTLVASLVTTSANTIAVDEDVFLEAGTQLELHGSILNDHMQRAVRDEIFSQRYRFRSLKQEQERATNENHDLRMDIADERHERLELIDRVAKRGRRQESKGEY